MLRVCLQRPAPGQNPLCDLRLGIGPLYAFKYETHNMVFTKTTSQWVSADLNTFTTGILTSCSAVLGFELYPPKG